MREQKGRTVTFLGLVLAGGKVETETEPGGQSIWGLALGITDPISAQGHKAASCLSFLEVFRRDFLDFSTRILKVH